MNINSKPVIGKKRIIKKLPVTKTDDNYTIALINYDLVKNHNQLIAVAANEKENADSSFYVKIEEQQSGKKQMSVYYFQLKKNKGNTSVKPLLLLSKPVDIKKTIKKPADSTSSHERVTS